jgi:purine-binding chemotaxis protein CheW
MSVSEITETRQYLTFKLGNEIFATDVAKVREVLDLTTITEIPRTPEFMAGVINLRGSVVPVVDLRLCFEMSKTENTRNTCIVVVEVLLENESTIIGALTDSVEEVIDLEPNQIQPAPRIGTQIKTDFIKGMGKRDTQFIIILDIDRVFSSEELIAVRGQAQEVIKQEVVKQETVNHEPAKQETVKKEAVKKAVEKQPIADSQLAGAAA